MSGDQRGSPRGKRVRCLAAGCRRPTHGTTDGPRTREHLGSFRGVRATEGDDCRRSRRDQDVGLASCPQLGSQGRCRHRRPECALAGGSIPARVRAPGHLNAGDERDRPGSSSPSAVSAGAALPDRAHWLRGRGHPRGVPRRGFDCIWSSQEIPPYWSSCSDASARMRIQSCSDRMRQLGEPQ